MTERLENRLKRLNIGRPDPALRKHVLGAADIALTGCRESWSWRVDALLAAGVAAAAAMVLLLEPIAIERTDPLPCIDQASIESLNEGHHLDPVLEARYRSRLCRAARRLAAKRRIAHERRDLVIKRF